ncbi:MAG: hypothetical protein JWQ40_3478 [Segetibacter sp.]|jgi:hypothetical protein|nr:hypothetical protein [Segetibacter sp.]
MKDKKHKYLEDLLDEYIDLQDEQIEIPALVEKAQKKFSQYVSSDTDAIYKHSDAEDLYKVYITIKKHEERKAEIHAELTEVEEVLKGFLTSLKGGKVSYEKKDDNDKSKVTFLFWLEDDQVKCNR